MNKKGFTLIELLAVIAILAILLLLVTPNILDMFTKGRKEAFVSKVQSVYRAAEMDYVNDALSGTKTNVSYCSDNIKSDFNLTNCSPIKIINDTPNYYVLVSSNGKINQIVMSDDNFCYDGITINIDSNSQLNEGKKITCSENNNIINCTCN